MVRYILAFLAALVLVVGAFWANHGGSETPPPRSRPLPSLPGGLFR
jgi:hypothetical protein